MNKHAFTSRTKKSPFSGSGCLSSFQTKIFNGSTYIAVSELARLTGFETASLERIFHDWQQNDSSTTSVIRENGKMFVDSHAFLGFSQMTNLPEATHEIVLAALGEWGCEL